MMILFFVPLLRDDLWAKPSEYTASCKNFTHFTWSFENEICKFMVATRFCIE